MLIFTHKFDCQKSKTRVVINHFRAMFRKRVLLLLVTVIFAAGFYSCGLTSEKDRQAVVSVSILPLEFFIDRLTGGALDVNVMIPPGAGHATYSPTTGQFRKLSESGIYFRIGHLGYERAWIGRMSDMNPDMRVVDLSDGIELIRGKEIDHGDHVHEGGIDPHIWMSPKVVLELLPVIKAALSEKYPNLAVEVIQNYALLQSEIAAIDAEMRAFTASLESRRFMIFHPALTYLARDYGLEQVSIERGGKEPSPAALSRIIREAKKHEVPVILIQQEFDMRSAALISQESGAALVQINPLAYNWTESMREIINIFKTYLQ